jgi:beta-mannosidase
VKKLRLKPATLKVEVEPAPSEVVAAGGGASYVVRVTSPVLARSVYLSFGNLDVKLSDNYFDVLPGETVELTATSAASLAGLKGQLKAISLTDAFAVNPQPAAVTAVK